jgi:spermidine synthase
MAMDDKRYQAGTDWPAGDWLIDLDSPVDFVALKKEKVLATGKTAFQDYEIFENSQWGRTLMLDDRLQSAEVDEFVYHEALVHPVMVAHPDPRRVLILGGGEGATLREVLRHRLVAQVVMVDIDGELVDVCRQWLPSFHQGAFDDPRVSLVHKDARAWLAEQRDGSFEVIIVDLPEPLEEGPASLLFTREMYEVVRRKLAPKGLMSVQSGSGNIFGHLMADINRTLRAVFHRVFAYTAFVTGFMDLYSFHVAGREEFVWPNASQIKTRLEARGLTDLRWYEPEFGAGLPKLPRYLKDRLATGGRVLTDAEPYKSHEGGRQSF